MFRMRRATGIKLVLLGGGLAVGLATCSGSRSAECREAKKYNLPDADRLCSDGSRGGGSGGSSRAAPSSTYVEGSDRGGFGHTATRHASAGG